MTPVSSELTSIISAQTTTKKPTTAEERTSRAIALSVTPDSQQDLAAIFSLSSGFNSAPDISLENLVYNSTAKYQSYDNGNSISVEDQIAELVATYRPASEK